MFAPTAIESFSVGFTRSSRSVTHFGERKISPGTSPGASAILLLFAAVEKLRAMGRAYVDFALEHPHHYRFMFMSPHPSDPELMKECEGKHGNPDQDGYAFLHRVVGECLEQKRFAKPYRDHAMLTQLHWAAAHGVVSLFITHGKDQWVDFTKPKETAYALLDVVLAGMTSPAEAAVSVGGKRAMKVPAKAAARTGASRRSGVRA